MQNFFQQTEIESKLRLKFREKELLARAFTHRSYWNEHSSTSDGHNERLEFLGDSVLSLLIAEYLFQHYPEMDEGKLSSVRSQLVDAPACASYVQILEIAPFLLLGKGEKTNQGKGRESILADLFEALMGALYLDQGIDAARTFFFSHFQANVDQMVQEPLRNWKAELQDVAQKKYQEPPVYQVDLESGLPHQKHFVVSVWVKDSKWGEGAGGSKKEAQIAAAKNALIKMELKDG